MTLHISLRAKLLSAIVSVGIMMGMFVVINTMIVQRVQDRLMEVVTLHTRLIWVTGDLERLIYRMARAEKRFMHTGDPQAMDRLEERRDEVEKSFNRLQPLMKTEKGLTSLKAMRESYRRHHQLVRKEEKLFREGKIEEVKKLSYGPVWREVNTMERLLDEISRESVGMMGTIQKDSEGFIGQIRSAMRVMMGGAFILLLAIGVVLFQVERGIRQVSRGMALVAERKFDVELPDTRRQDELGAMERMFNAMVREIRSLTKRLEEEATVDPLTQLKNRRSFQRILQEEAVRAKRYGHALTVAMLDLDGFKQFNDTHGHPAGDAVLKKVGEILQTHVRDVDEVGRYGGEEFIVLFPETNVSGAQHILERIRSEIQLAFRAGQPALTISGGVVGFPDGIKDPEGLVEAADKLLYQAKRAGKNRIESPK